MPGKFVVKKGTTGKFRFNLPSTNGQVVATGETYNSKASAMGGIRAVRSLAATQRSRIKPPRSGQPPRQLARRPDQ